MVVEVFSRKKNQERTCHSEQRKRKSSLNHLRNHLKYSFKPNFLFNLPDLPLMSSPSYRHAKQIIPRQQHTGSELYRHQPTALIPHLHILQPAHSAEIQPKFNLNTGTILFPCESSLLSRECQEILLQYFPHTSHCTQRAKQQLFLHQSFVFSSITL